MSKLNIRTILIVGACLSAAAGGLPEYAFAQDAKAKAKPSKSQARPGQMICNAQGCRAVQPGCRVETNKLHGSGQVEVCN
jgi:hypothetical protein